MDKLENEKNVIVNTEQKPMKLSYDRMQFLFQTHMDDAMHKLFSENAEHGWTLREFEEMSAYVQQAVQERKIQQWLN